MPIAAPLLSVVLLATWLVGIKVFMQRASDQKHRTYRIESFPSETDPDKLANWIHAITGTLRPGMLGYLRIGPVPAVVFEVRGSRDGITHLLRIPWQHEYIIDQLYSHIPGIRIVREDGYKSPVWQHAVEVGAAYSARTFDLEPERMWHTIRSTLTSCRGDEQVLMQWVVTPALPTELPEAGKAQSVYPTLTQRLTGKLEATRGEVDERRKKNAEPNMLAVLRIASYAKTDERAVHLLNDVSKAMASGRGRKARFTRRPLAREVDVIKRIMQAQTPFSFPIKLNLTELVSLIGWPVGSALVPGITASMSPQLAPSPLIPSTGRVIGVSNMYRQRRDIAVSYASAVRHEYVLGITGSGKTNMLADSALQDMDHDCGVFVFDAKTGDESLIYQVAQRIPSSRVQDVIYIDVSDDQFPVGFNFLDQGNTRSIIDEFSTLIFDNMFGDVNKAVTAPPLFYYMMNALAEVPGSTLIDLLTLITPTDTRTPAGAWRHYVADQVKNRNVKEYVNAFLQLTPVEQNNETRALRNRIWEFMVRPEIRYMLGQRTSSFNMRDVITSNKILLVKLNKSSGLLGTLLVKAIWDAAQAVTPDKPNFLYLDEFASFMNWPVDIEDILRLARSSKLGMTLAHQNLSQINPKLRAGVLANTATKVILRTSAADGGYIAPEFGGYVGREAFPILPRFEALAMIGTDTGYAPPVSLVTKKLGRPTGNMQAAIRLSRERYGRSRDVVEHELTNYLIPEQTSPPQRRPRISGD